MSSEPFLGGYLIYLLEIIVPGIGFGELLGVWEGENIRLVNRIAYAFGLGLAIDTSALAVRTSGLTIAGHALRGLDYSTIYFIIGVGILALGISILRRRKVLFPIRPTLQDAELIIIMGCLALMIVFYFQKYPIFPEYQGPDYGNHTLTALQLVSGLLVSIPAGILYYGVHFQLASALIVVGGDPLVTARITMGLLVVLSPLLVNLATSRIFSSPGAGLVAAAAYVFSGTIWFVSVFDSGLYANFFGILISLFVLVVFVDLCRNIGSSRSWVLFILAIDTEYF